MSTYDWNFTLPESVLKTQEKLSGLAASAQAMSEAWKAAVPHYDFSGAYATLNAYLNNYENISKQAAQISSIAKSVLPLIDTSALDNLKRATAMTKALQSVDWEWLVKAYTDAFGNEGSEDQEASEKITEEAVTPEIRAEIAADVKEVLAEPESMHITSRNKYLQWAKESPEHALQFLNTLLVIIQTIIMMLEFGITVWQARPVKNSQVYEEPTSTSNIVYNVTVENNITVIGDVPYYYEVEFFNPETGELVTGYIYKGNVTAAEPNETEAYEEETAVTEESEPTPDATASQTEPTE